MGQSFCIAAARPAGGPVRRRSKSPFLWSIALLLLAIASWVDPVQAQQAPATATPSFGFVGVEVEDIEATKKFYIDGIGMKQALVLSTPTDPFQKIGLNFTGDPATGGTLLILTHYDKPGRSPTRGALIGILVPDTHAAAARLRANGYQVLKEPGADDKGAVLTSLARDPGGHLVELSELRGMPRR